ncbi:hypothetical protein PHYBOEH_009916 [Phytophthora boehmeriae]|uniref:Uncharacterized protein n=1 Tax=Phytophthora boehmeriae TaxID=109152 RepID=A0A8T1WZK0_9STRA|nr:hypothetical protein PHYBOEH_009916 [Phytophthora boehmeriae]
MRSFNGDVCAYGLNNQAGYFFSQNALRQRSFGRARGFMNAPTKRKTRDQDEEPQRAPWRRRDSRVLDGIKRMRLSSPPESPKTDDMTDEEAATPRSTWSTHQAIVPAKTATFAPATTKVPSAEAFWTQQQPQIPTDASCRAMVVFNPYQTVNLDSKPQVELVESEEDEQEDETESEGECVRFEELPSDNDEPVDMDVD